MPRRPPSLALRTALAVAVALAACAPSAASPPSSARALDPIDAGAIDAANAEEDEGEEGAEQPDGEDADDDAATALGEGAGRIDDAPCPLEMVLVEAGELRFCIDRYEASLVEVASDGTERPYPHWLPVDGHVVRAVSQPGVYPQGFISELQAEDACGASGKRLCAYDEWKTACLGPEGTTFPYGNSRAPGTCHDEGKSAVAAVFGLRALSDPGLVAHPAKTPKRATKTSAKASVKRGTKSGAKIVKKTGAKRGTAKPARGAKPTRDESRPHASRPTGAGRGKVGRTKESRRPVSVEPSVWTQLNDPRLGQVEGALAKTGSHEACVSGYGVLDLVGNLHEWVKTDPAAPRGTFAGGYYLDTTLNGDGCHYRTTAHAHDYHDYSTGFRCCADAAPR